jgi:hypothetical protein
MPLVRMFTSVAGADFAYAHGEEVDLAPEEAQRYVAAGWAELVRGRAPETPENRASRPETPEGGGRRATRQRDARHREA